MICRERGNPTAEPKLPRVLFDQASERSPRPERRGGVRMAADELFGAWPARRDRVSGVQAACRCWLLAEPLSNRTHRRRRGADVEHGIGVQVFDGGSDGGERRHRDQRVRAEDLVDRGKYRR